jgi:hypothetical protein
VAELVRRQGDKWNVVAEVVGDAPEVIASFLFGELRVAGIILERAASLIRDLSL